MRNYLITLFLFVSIFTQVNAQSNYKDAPIFPLQNKHVHGSSIVECPNGDLLACWFHGSGERTSDDVLIQGARLKKGTKIWSAVFLMADTPEFPDCNPVLFIDKEERLWLFWIAVTAHRWERSILKYRRSSDYQKDGPPNWEWQDVILLKPGEKFSRAVEQGFKENVKHEAIWAEYAFPYERMIVEATKDPVKRQIGWMTRIHPLALQSGRILLPLYSDGFNICLVAISDDLGVRWRASSPMVGLGPIQPTLVQKKDGTVVAYFRDSGDPPMRVMKSISKDEGETWSFAVDTDIPNPGSSLEVIALQDGRWLMAYNDTEDGRHSMALALSDDEGETWKWKKNINVIGDRSKSYGYPSLIQTRDGMFHLTFTYKEKGGKAIKHAVFGVDWIVK
ncbi:exo-alpha-sialidase [candidate division KSB1 bacterium]|nr:exo-alpha-sialidase [candidate division KSB1 bacterium]MBL7093647.1 exo-alpha-sialidase [candidate division KSB1 bacterium]